MLALQLVQWNASVPLRRMERSHYIPGVDVSWHYVWLPLRFKGDRVLIDWHDEWRIEDFADR